MIIILYVFDVEGDSLTPTIIWCVSWHNLDTKESGTITDIGKMKEFFTQKTTFIGHAITIYDIPVVERLLKIKVTAKLIDTLGLSWYLYPRRARHGLEYWGEDFGVEKPPIDDWENLPLEVYIHRCEEDVKINTQLWNKIWNHLTLLYDTEEDANRLIMYVSMKLDTIRQQESNGWPLDINLMKKSLRELSAEFEIKNSGLAKVMPKEIKYVKKSRPKKPFKQSGEVSAIGEKWFALLRKRNLHKDYDGIVKVKFSEEVGNPGSNKQLKEWLFSLGWEPMTFKFDREDDGSVRKIPQIRKLTKPELCDSIVRLLDKEPNLKLLDGVTVLKHRISILKGFERDVDENGMLHARASGFTNTFRLKHKELVNLPGVHKPYGDIIRGCLISWEGYESCGSDMSGLEDRLKQHYIQPHDPDYVAQLQDPTYDSHLDICVLAGILTEEQSQQHKDGDKDFSKERHAGKTGNYACQYGGTAFAVSKGALISIEAAQIVVDAYWKKNWAIKKVAEEQYVKAVKGEKWLFNPISRFWYSLRAEKDRFSTLVQGSASYCFDLWIYNVSKTVPNTVGQFHDENIWMSKLGNRKKTEENIHNAMNKTNQQLKLNVLLDCDVQFGHKYSEIH